MPTNRERRKIAGLLRGMSGDTAGLSDGEFIDLVTEIVRGVDVPAWQDPDAAFLNRLADLIDPTAHECTVADNLALIERNRELERELKACKAKLGDVSRLTNALEGEADDGTWEGARIAADRRIVACWIKEAIG